MAVSSDRRWAFHRMRTGPEDVPGIVAAPGELLVKESVAGEEKTRVYVNRQIKC